MRQKSFHVHLKGLNDKLISRLIGSVHFIHHFVSSAFTFVYREQALKKRLALVHDSLSTAVPDSAPHRRDSGEQLARLSQAHR